MSAISPNFPALRRDVLARIDAFRGNVRRHLALEGLARWLAELVAFLFLSFIADRLLRLSVPARVTIVVLGAVYLAVQAIRYILVPAKTEMTAIGLAAAIDRSLTDRPEGTRPVLAARVASVLELPSLLESEAAPSEAMVSAAVTRCYDALDAINFDEHINVERRRRARMSIVALLILPLVLTIISPASAALWFRRYFLGSHQPWPQKTYLMVQGVEDGRLVVPRAEPFSLRVTTRAGSVDPQSVDLRYREGKGSRNDVAMSRFAQADWRYDFPPLGSEASVTISGNDDVQDFRIVPIDRPRVTDLVLVSQHPTEKQPTTHHFGGLDADWAFLPKTKLSLTFTANVPIEVAKLKGLTRSPSVADLRRVDARSFSLSWTHETPVQLEIELVGAGARLASVPLPVSVGLKQDLPPRVGLTFSGVRQRISPAATIPLSIQARDDYGVARVDLTTHAQVITDVVATAAATKPSEQTNTSTLAGPVIPPTDLEVQVSPRLNVGAMKLPAGSILSVIAAATDDCYLGAQTGQSRQLTFRIVPPDELFREILQRQQAERIKFRKQLEEARKLKDKIGAIASAQAASEAARDHRAIQHEVLRISNAIAQGVTEMKLNQLGNKDAWDLMDNKVLAPLKKLNDDTMNQQKDALDALKPGDAAARAAAAGREEQIASMMQDVLKQMAQWDSFVDVLNQLNEIIKLENTVHQSTDTLRKKQTEGVFENP